MIYRNAICWYTAWPRNTSCMNILTQNLKSANAKCCLFSWNTQWQGNERLGGTEGKSYAGIAGRPRFLPSPPHPPSSFLLTQISVSVARICCVFFFLNMFFKRYSFKNCHVPLYLINLQRTI